MSTVTAAAAMTAGVDTLDMDEDDTIVASSSTPVPILSPAFLHFLHTHHLSTTHYTAQLQHPLRRYIRLHPLAPSDTIDRMRADGIHVTETALPNFYALAATQPLVSCEAYKSAHIYGMDLASGVAVLALDVRRGQHVLDLCAAPGTKMCYMADLLRMHDANTTTATNATRDTASSATTTVSSTSSTSTSTSTSPHPLLATGTITAVDLSLPRLTSARRLMLRYHVPHIRMFWCDGTSFSAGRPDVPIYASHIMHATHVTPEQHHAMHANMQMGSARTRQKRAKREMRKQHVKRQQDKKRKLEGGDAATGDADSTSETADTAASTSTSTSTSTATPFVAHPLLPHLLYDRILIDAECTHDGSIRHILKARASAADWTRFESHLTDARIAHLQHTQRALIRNGYRLLRYDGVLVYSTCSMAQAQNEDVVEWLLQQHPDAECIACHIDGVKLVACDDTEQKSSHDDDPTVLMYTRGYATSTHPSLAHCLRFDPLTSATSGLFIAKIRKRETGAGTGTSTGTSTSVVSDPVFTSDT